LIEQRNSDGLPKNFETPINENEFGMSQQ